MNNFFISDTHFSHEGILRFTHDDGTLIRPGFSDIHHMNEFMIEQWNSVVKPEDRVYHLGDVAMGATVTKTLDTILPRLNGTKRMLLLGNHDMEVPTLCKHFKKVRLWRIFKDEGFVCSHLPLKVEQFRHKVMLNVHGHIHQRVIDDARYFNVSVEQHNYTPVHMDEVLQRVRLAREAIEKLEPSNVQWTG